MKLQLLIAGQYSNCLDARDIWQQVCRQRNIELQIIELDDPQGRALSQQLDIRSYPVLIADGQIKAVGKPDLHRAQAIITQMSAAVISPAS